LVIESLKLFINKKRIPVLPQRLALMSQLSARAPVGVPMPGFSFRNLSRLRKRDGSEL
jgi:hypothetical protein